MYWYLYQNNPSEKKERGKEPRMIKGENCSICVCVCVKNDERERKDEDKIETMAPGSESK